MDVSIVIPAYKSAKILDKTVSTVCEKMASFSSDFEVIIVTGDNPDSTVEVARAIGEKNPVVRLVLGKGRYGKGKAIRAGFSKARGKIVAYTDADLEIGTRYLVEALKKVEGGCDVAIASKHFPDSEFKCPLRRKFFSMSYNALVRLVLGGKLCDYQGGLKAFSKSALKKILPLTRDDWWFWDTEALMIAEWFGYSVCEIPIKGRYGFGDSTLGLWNAITSLFISVFALKKRRLGELSAIRPERSVMKR